MSSYRCPNGHVSTLDFGEHLKIPCPECKTYLFKFRDFFPQEQDIVEPADVASQNPNAKKQRNAIFIGMAALTALALWWGYYRPAPVPVAVAPRPVLPVSAAKSAPPAVAVKNVLSEVTISELHVAMTPQGAVSASFVLTNNGGPYNDYPSLRVHWPDSAAADAAIYNTAYAHPETPFTRVAVTTELVKPADATGVEINLQY